MESCSCWPAGGHTGAVGMHTHMLNYCLAAHVSKTEHVVQSRLCTCVVINKHNRPGSHGKTRASKENTAEVKRMNDGYGGKVTDTRSKGQSYEMRKFRGGVRHCVHKSKRSNTNRDPA